MIEINVPNVISIFLISLLAVAIFKAGAHMAGKDDWAAKV